MQAGNRSDARLYHVTNAGAIEATLGINKKGHIFYTAAGGGLDIYKSTDDGDTWITNPLACGRPINDHQTLFSGPPAIASAPTFPEVVYYCD